VDGTLLLGNNRFGPKVGSWHIASFGCAAEFSRYRRMADIEQAAPIKLD
jgi:hypothetical protein